MIIGKEKRDRNLKVKRQAGHGYSKAIITPHHASIPPWHPECTSKASSLHSPFLCPVAPVRVGTNCCDGARTIGFPRMDHVLEALFRLAIEALPASIAGWLGLRLLAWSVGQAQKPVRLGGPYAFLVVWGIAVFVNFKAIRRVPAIISPLYISLFALGLLAWLVRAIVQLFMRPSQRH